MTEDTDRDVLIDVLAYYGELGVDCAFADPPVDWLQHGDRAPGYEIRQTLAGTAQGTVTRAARPAADRPGPPASAGREGSAGRSPSGAARSVSSGTTRGASARPASPGVPEARKLVAGAKTLADLRQALEGFEGCPLKATAKSTCFYRGADASRLMIIGEAPGRDEDIEGRPFVGRAGQLLDRMLAAIGLDETGVHITNVVYWRPPGNRTPTLQETDACRPFLERQVQLVDPDIVLLLGGAAAKTLLDVADGIMRSRGKWRDLEIGGRRRKVLATLHPAYLLRTPAAKRLVWRDLLALDQALGHGK